MSEEIVIPDNVSIFDFLDTDDTGYDHGEPDTDAAENEKGAAEDERIDTTTPSTGK